ncbi:MAG: hypothetical protein KatS3mg031_1144 [Chitinophagales bacterium]|nr:MAG: hypothetical protein KatS3mg031_1144 [Chitinophagales bacterium]
MRTILVLLCVSTFSGISFSQDIHFSQFYASPLTLNPALTGFIDGTYRLTAIYRNQWRSVTTPYHTVGASFDMRLLDGKIKDVLGAGASAVYDQAGDGNLSLMSLMASGAYSKVLGKSKRHFIGAGIQLGYVYRSLDYNSLLFPQQYNATLNEFDQAQTNGESFQGTGISYFDMAAGLMWSSMIGKRFGIFAGGALHHLTTPKESFLGREERLSRRATGHAGLHVKASEHIVITPNVLFMYQNKARELHLGSAVEWHFHDPHNTVISLGGWYRLEDAGVITLGFEHRGLRVGFAYDVNTSGLKPASHSRGAFEIAVLYVGKITKVEAPVLVPCPRL